MKLWVVCVTFEVKGKLGAVLTTFELKGKLGNHVEDMGCLCHFLGEREARGSTHHI